MDTLSTADTWELLGLVKSYHSPMDLSDSTAAAWQMAFQGAGVTNLADAKQAVVVHYSTPGANPWIIPGDVIGRYQEIRMERLRDLPGDEVLMAGVDRDDPRWTQIKAARVNAVANGAPQPRQITAGGRR